MSTDSALHLNWPQSTSCSSDAVGSPIRRRVRAVSTTRQGGTSKPPFDSFNLGYHVGDDPGAVDDNRARLNKFAGDDIRFCWLTQVHGTTVVDAADVADADAPVEADASVSRTPGLACAVLTADCLPVLMGDRDGTCVAAAHAGWRGLAAGILEATVDATDTDPSRLVAWLGAAIGPDVFEVGPEVVDAFVASDEGARSCFRASPFHPDSRWVGDLYELARRRLRRCGIEAIVGGGACTYSDENRFFSYRRDGTTGRMATAIWLRDRN